MFDCLRGKKGCYCWASGPQLVPPNVRACTRPPCKNLKFSLSVLIRFFFFGVHRFLSMEIVMFYGTCESFWDASWRICLIQVAVFIWRSKIHPRLQDFFIPGWFVHYSLKTTRGIFLTYGESIFVIFFSWFRMLIFLIFLMIFRPIYSRIDNFKANNFCKKMFARGLSF